MHKMLIALLVLTAGCQVGPVYHPPQPETPQEWKSPYEQVLQPNLCYWWEIFNDDTLNRLEEIAIANNPTVLMALDRIAEAWADAGIAESELYPGLNLSPAYNTTKIYPRIHLSRPIPGFQKRSSFQINQLTVPVNMQYEIDLWGKYRNQYQAAVANAQSVEEAYKSALLSLTAQVASNYFTLRMYDALLEKLSEIIATHEREFKLNSARYQKGIVTDIDPSSALTNLANAKANFDDAFRKRELAENMIATLIGTPASLFQLESNPLWDPPPSIPPALPSTVLLQRPDVAAAERQMAANNALVGVAYSDFFPSFSLTGVVEYLSLDIKHVIKVLSSLWSLGVNANQPLYDGGRRSSALDGAIARFQEASDQYQQQVLTAFQEVEDVLISLEYQHKQYDHLAQAVEAAKKTTSLSKRRYLQGIVNYIEVVDYERTQFNDELDYIQVNGARYQSTVQLIKALGGGWRIECND